jgi:hypothetical protein
MDFVFDWDCSGYEPAAQWVVVSQSKATSISWVVEWGWQKVE